MYNKNCIVWSNAYIQYIIQLSVHSPNVYVLAVDDEIFHKFSAIGIPSKRKQKKIKLKLKDSSIACMYVCWNLENT